MAIHDKTVFETYYEQIEAHLKDSGDTELKRLLGELKGAHDRHVDELNMLVEGLSGGTGASL